MAELSVITYSGKDGYIVAECVEIPGCLSQGKTKEAKSDAGRAPW
jgi:predicted RNase H-like HicB family nuclease